MTETSSKLEKLRSLMRDNRIDAMIVTSSNPHQTEYTPDYWNALEWLTNFTGSTGIIVITLKKAGLWTDFRYWIQAELQINLENFNLFKMSEPGTPEVNQWLLQNLKFRNRVSVDGWLASLSYIREIRNQLKDKEIDIITDLELIAQLWHSRPPMPCSPAWDFSKTFTGISTTDKLSMIRENMVNADTEWELISDLDNIAWIFNLRGYDVPFTPVNIAYSLIGLNHAFLFIAPEKIDKNLASVLKKSGITLRNYKDVYNTLKKLKYNEKICLDPAKTPYALFEAINPKVKIIESPCRAESLKTVKNQTEITHIHETMLKDGAAMTNFLYWLEQQVCSVDISEKAGSNIAVTEISAAQAVYQFRQEQPGFMDNAFTPIMAQGDHSAMCHYSATYETNRPIGTHALFLTDSGGQYLTGTTDITRTIHMGQPTMQEILDYTLVLKGLIALAEARFPAGTKGVQIDALARQFLWQEGSNFGHGTGHGIGFYLGVHEGPIQISPYLVDAELKAGMLLSNEPGIYRKGAYGIRLENMILIKESLKTEFGLFLEFENLTLCHFESKLIDLSLLSQKEIKWINQYHDQVFSKIAPFLKSEVREWLREKTCPLFI